mgnify:CR=1 FL=1
MNYVCQANNEVFIMQDGKHLPLRRKDCNELLKKYQELCHSQFGLDALPAILSFTRQVSVYVPQVVLSVVDKDMSQKEIAECERLARQTGALFRIRAYIED